MAFSEEYLSACVALRRRLQAKEAWLGDWYIDVATGELDVVSRALEEWRETSRKAKARKKQREETAAPPATREAVDEEELGGRDYSAWQIFVSEKLGKRKLTEAAPELSKEWKAIQAAKGDEYQRLVQRARDASATAEAGSTTPLGVRQQAQAAEV